MSGAGNRMWVVMLFPGEFREMRMVMLVFRWGVGAMEYDVAVQVSVLRRSCPGADPMRL